MDINSNCVLQGNAAIRGVSNTGSLCSELKRETSETRILCNLSYLK